jgi:hypothetical protein
MKKVLLFALACMILIQIGCVQAIRYSEEEIKNFPQNFQDNIRKGEIDLGMTQEQVRYSWGSPESARVLPPLDGKLREEWTYGKPWSMGVFGLKILLFLDGKLVYIK